MKTFFLCLVILVSSNALIITSTDGKNLEIPVEKRNKMDALMDKYPMLLIKDAEIYSRVKQKLEPRKHTFIYESKYSNEEKISALQKLADRFWEKGEESEKSFLIAHAAVNVLSNWVAEINRGTPLTASSTLGNESYSGCEDPQLLSLHNVNEPFIGQEIRIKDTDVFAQLSCEKNYKGEYHFVFSGDLNVFRVSTKLSTIFGIETPTENVCASNIVIDYANKVYPGENVRSLPHELTQASKGVYFSCEETNEQIAVLIRTKIGTQYIMPHRYSYNLED